jgi:ABC-2 type transport system ATP-binding protein|tara:strand:+ start:77 stop:937 length:861 start_codon:yes stop_codon:yes gene_type:complete
MSRSPVSCSGLRKRFRLPNGGWQRALDRVSLEVQTGEIFGLLGPNGAGKTTLIKILLGFVSPDEDSFSLAGSAGHLAIARRRVGYVPDGPFFHPFAKAKEVLTWQASLAGLPRLKAKAEVERVAQQAGLETVLDRRLDGFSKGMLQRLAIAQALLGDPELVIMDEPTSGLDPEAVEAFAGLLKRLKGEGKTILLSTHLLPLAETLCDRVALLHRGRVAMSGRIDALLQPTGAHTLSVEGFDPSKSDRVAELLGAEGVSLASSSVQRPTLEARFLAFLREASKEGNE